MKKESTREEEIVKMREKDKMTLEQIGLRFGISRKRARQIYLKATKKL